MQTVLLPDETANFLPLGDQRQLVAARLMRSSTICLVHSPVLELKVQTNALRSWEQVTMRPVTGHQSMLVTSKSCCEGGGQSRNEGKPVRSPAKSFRPGPLAWPESRDSRPQGCAKAPNRRWTCCPRWSTRERHCCSGRRRALRIGTGGGTSWAGALEGAGNGGKREGLRAQHARRPSAVAPRERLGRSRTLAADARSAC